MSSDDFGRVRISSEEFGISSEEIGRVRKSSDEFGRVRMSSQDFG